MCEPDRACGPISSLPPIFQSLGEAHGLGGVAVLIATLLLPHFHTCGEMSGLNHIALHARSLQCTDGSGYVGSSPWTDHVIHVACGAIMLGTTIPGRSSTSGECVPYSHLPDMTNQEMCVQILVVSDFLFKSLTTTGFVSWQSNILLQY